MAQPPAPGASGPRRRWRRVAIALAGVAGLLLLVGMVAPVVLSRVLVDTLEARLGGQVQLSLSMSMLGPRPGLRIHDLNWHPAPPVEGSVTIAEIRIDTDWFARDDVRTVQLRLRDVRLELHETPDGRWPMPALATEDAGDGGGVGGFALGGVTLAQLQLRLVPRRGAPVDLAIEEAGLRPDGDGWQLALAGRVQQGERRWVGPLTAKIKPVAGGLAVDSVSIEGEAQLGSLSASDLRLAAQGVRLAAGTVDARTIELDGTVQHAAGASDSTAVRARITGLRFDSNGLRATIDSLALTRAEPDPVSIGLGLMRWTQSAAGIRVAPLRGSARLTRAEGAITLEAEDGALDYTLASGQAALTGGRLRLSFPDPKTPTTTVSAVAQLSGEGVPADGRGEGRVQLTLEDSTLDARWVLDLAKTPPLRLVAQVDRLDLDRWLPASSDARAPAPLTVWRDWPLQADLSVGRLTWHGVELRKARVTLGQPDPGVVP